MRVSAATTKTLLQRAPMKDFARARAKDCMRSRTSHGLKVIRMCTRARLAGATRDSFFFQLQLVAHVCVSNDSEEEAQQGARRVIIPEPPGLELPGLPDFLPPRSVETEAREVQRGVTANAGSRLRPKTLCPKKSATSFPTRRACLFQLERMVEERESDTLPLRRSSIASEQFLCSTETHPRTENRCRNS